mgnify:CR=1 FL=1
MVGEPSSTTAQRCGNPRTGVGGSERGRCKAAEGEGAGAYFKYVTKPEPDGNAADAPLSPANYHKSMGRGRHTEVLLFTCLNGKIAAPAANIGIPTAKASTWKGGFLWLVNPLKPSSNI